MYHSYSLTYLGPAHANLKVYNSTGMHAIGSHVFYDHAHNKQLQGPSFNISDIEGSVLLSFTDTPTPGLVLASDKLGKRLPNSSKLAFSQVDRSDVFTVNKRTQRGSAGQPINRPQPHIENTEIVHTKEHMMNLFPDSLHWMD